MTSVEAGLTVGVVFDTGGSADLRDLVREARTGVGSWLLLPPRVAAAYPQLLRLGRTLLAGASVIGEDDHSAGRLAGVTTFSDELSEVAAACAADLGCPWGIPQAALDKLSQRQALAQAGLTRVRALPARDLAELDRALRLLGTPGFVKARRGHGGNGVREIRTSQDLYHVGSDLSEQTYYETAIAPATAPASMPWLSDMVSVEVAASHSGETFAVAAFSKLALHRPPATRTGSTHARLVTTGNLYPWALPGEQAGRAVQLAEDAVRALRLRGVLAHVEIRWGADGPDVIEVNCRMGGHLAGVARAAGGVDLVSIALMTAAGAKTESIAPIAVSSRAAARRHAVGVRIPLPAPVGLSSSSREHVRSTVTRADLAVVVGQHAVVEHRSRELDSPLADDYAAEVLVTASSVPSLERSLHAVLTDIAGLYADDGVQDTPWLSQLLSNLDHRDPPLQLKDST